MSDAAYFRGRAEQEKLAADVATHDTARQAHLDLATRYEDLAKAITGRERYLGLHFDAP